MAPSFPIESVRMTELTMCLAVLVHAVALAKGPTLGMGVNTVTLPGRKPSALNSVAGILNDSAEIQVIWIYASANVATMQHPLSIGNRSIF